MQPIYLCILYTDIIYRSEAEVLGQVFSEIGRCRKIEDDEKNNKTQVWFQTPRKASGSGTKEAKTKRKNFRRITEKGFHLVAVR